MLTDRRQRETGLTRFVSELHRQTDVLEAVGVAQPHAARLGLGVVEGLAQVFDRCKPDVPSGEPLDPLVAASGRETLPQEVDQGLLMRARSALGERHEVGPAELAEQGTHELELLRAEHDVPAIAGAIDVVERAAPQAALVLRHGRAVVGEHLPGDVRGPGECAVVHRDVDEVAASGLLTAQQGHHDAAESEQ